MLSMNVVILFAPAFCYSCPLPAGRTRSRGQSNQARWSPLFRANLEGEPADVALAGATPLAEREKSGKADGDRAIYFTFVPLPPLLRCVPPDLYSRPPRRG